MVNVNKLKGTIVEKGFSLNSFSDRLSIEKSTFYRKINASGETFSIKEADEIAHALNLTYDEVMLIFFAQYVA
ncbi:MAG: XRE family transcriptional regulator [Ruminococcaceae bacterium]|nr:XRE family transcriptional regulator [Oscillospiraceae bacterium]